MAERSTADSGALSAEQLLTGIGKLIYSLNESVQGIGNRLERLEGSLGSLLETKLDGISAQLEKAGGHLEMLAEREPAAAVQAEPIQGGPPVPGLTEGFEGIAALLEQANSSLGELVEKQRSITAQPDTAVQGSPPPLDLVPVVEAVTTAVEGLREAVSAGPAVLAGMDAALSDIRMRMTSDSEALAPMVKSASDGIREIPASLEAVSGRVDAVLASVDELRTSMSEIGQSIVGGVEEAGAMTLPVLGEMREKLSLLDGIMINLNESMKSVNSATTGETAPQAMMAELEKLSAGIARSAETIGRTVAEALEKSDGSRGETLQENLVPMIEGIAGLAEGLEKVRVDVTEALKVIETGTARKVETISLAVENGLESQSEELGRMTELLTVHAKGVLENRTAELNRRAIVFYNNAEYPEARKLLEEALEASPESPELLANLAHVCGAMGDLEEAESSFRKALEADPGLEPAVSGLGALMLMGGRPDETIQFLTGFIDGGGTQSPGVFLALARAYVGSGRHTDAISILETALRTAPGHPEIERELAMYREDMPT